MLFYFVGPETAHLQLKLSQSNVEIVGLLKYMTRLFQRSEGGSGIIDRTKAR